MSFVELDRASVTYNGRGGGVEALSAVSFSAERGEAWAVIGPSGCGKSTLLYLLAGLIKPTSGGVFIDDKAVTENRRESAIILQDYGLFAWKTVFQNAALGLKIRHYPKVEVRERTATILQELGLYEFRNHFPAQLSGGMRQRVALARSLTLEPDLLLMDEPFSSLDALTREDLQNNMLEIRELQGNTGFLVTHGIEEAAFLGRKILVLTSRPGRVAEIVDNPGMGNPDYRNKPDFLEICSHLRELLKKNGSDGKDLRGGSDG